MEMRTQRMGLIQTEDQLRFSVEALILALKKLQGEVRKKENSKVVVGSFETY